MRRNKDEYQIYQSSYDVDNPNGGRTMSGNRKWVSYISGFLAAILLVLMISSGCMDAVSKPSPSEKDTKGSAGFVDDTEIQTEPETEPKTEPVTEIADDAIILIAGEQGEYGEMITYNKGTEFEENFYAYYVPVGTYEVKNIGDYTTQINVYSDRTVINEDGWEEPASVVSVKLISVGATVEVTVGEGEHIEIAEPTEISLVKK